MILRENSSIWRTDSVLRPHLSSSILTPPQALSLQILRLRLMDRRSLSDWQSPNSTSEDAAILARRIAQVSDARLPLPLTPAAASPVKSSTSIAATTSWAFESIRSKTTKYRDNKIALSLNSDVIPTARVSLRARRNLSLLKCQAQAKLLSDVLRVTANRIGRYSYPVYPVLLCALCVKDFDLPASATTIQISDGPARQEIHSHLVTSNLAPHINFVS